jgi:hypothetical protein
VDKEISNPSLSLFTDEVRRAQRVLAVVNIILPGLER